MKRLALLASMALIVTSYLFDAEVLCAQEYGGRMPPKQLIEMQQMLDAAERREQMEKAVPKYKDLVDLWTAGMLTAAAVYETRDYMPPEWYEKLMRLAICPSKCKFLTPEEMMDAGYPSYMWSTRSDDEDMTPK